MRRAPHVHFADASDEEIPSDFPDNQMKHWVDNDGVHHYSACPYAEFMTPSIVDAPSSQPLMIKQGVNDDEDCTFEDSQYSIYGEYSESTDTEASVATAEVTNSEGKPLFTKTVLSKLKTVLATRFNWNSRTDGRLSKYLRGCPGVLILPLEAYALIRAPHGGHNYDPVVLVYHPPPTGEVPSEYEHFNECIDEVH